LLSLAWALPAELSATQRQMINPIPPRIPQRVESRISPRRDIPIRILALRVEFVQDTLSTTTGNGRMAYTRSSSLYESFDDTVEIYFDPPPHDSLFFTDQLRFQDFYYSRMSGGALNFNWNIYPVGLNAAYQLPKQMWQYNWNSTDEQLDKGLAELFRDAVVAADNDPAIMWNSYDLVMVFHAGAGKEFDLGYRMTPHDIPSAWMVQADFAQQLNLPNGIPVDGGTNFVKGGLILPETESHDGVQIATVGVMCMLFGHWLGLPALYDKDDGKPVVGKWSLMDRGWGNFYGAIPGPVDAWSAAYEGWLFPIDIAPGAHQIESRFRTHPEVPLVFENKACRIPINLSEYFLLENRDRDPERDTVCYGFDRSGDTMLVFHEDYSVTRFVNYHKPIQAITSVDNLDFDSPGSGLLIWHIDEGLLSLMYNGRFNSVNELRGLDLEEADGAQDIGQEYPFLTPGWGTDYGVFEDAWYSDNYAHISANSGRYVMFGDNSFPNSRANSGAFTHITLDSFSRRREVMGFRYSQPGKLFAKRQVGYNGGSVVVGNFDDNIDSKEILIFSQHLFRIYDRDGHFLHESGLNSLRTCKGNNFAARDVNDDDRTDLIWANEGSFNAIVSRGAWRWDFVSFGYYGLSTPPLFTLGGRPEASVLAVTFSAGDSTYVRRYKMDFFENSLTLPSDAGAPWSLHRFGSQNSDTFIIVTRDLKIYRSTETGCEILANPPDAAPPIRPSDLYGSAVADFDGDGIQDVALRASYAQSGSRADHYLLVWRDLTDASNSYCIANQIDYRFQPSFPVDIDGDGRYEIYGTVPPPVNQRFDGRMAQIMVMNIEGTLMEGYPQPIFGTSELPRVYPYPQVFINLSPTSHLIISKNILCQADPHQPLRQGTPKYTLEIRKSDGSPARGFPLCIDEYTQILTAELDTIPGYDILIADSEKVTAYNLPPTYMQNQTLWWQIYRDNDRSNAVWEPARLFTPSAGAPLMPGELCYNWPNPATESTAIRYFLNESAQITVTIYDIAGDKVTTLHAQGQAGLPNEIEWNLKDIARGGYYAVVAAKSASRTEKKVVKIAVVK